MFPVLADVGPLRLSTRDIFTVTGLMGGLTLYHLAPRRERMLHSRVALISQSARPLRSGVQRVPVAQAAEGGT